MKDESNDILNMLDKLDLRPVWARRDLPPPVLKTGLVHAAAEKIREQEAHDGLVPHVNTGSD